MKSLSLLSCVVLALSLSACVPVEVHPGDVVITNRNAGVEFSGKPTSAAHVGPEYRFTGGDIVADFGSLHFALATSDLHKPLIVSCGGNGFRETVGGASTLEALAPFGDVLQFDYPGLGKSKGTGSKQDYDAAVRAILGKAEQLAAARGSSTVVFWGHSLGGGFCAALASSAHVKSMLVMDGAFADIADVVDGIAGNYALFVRAEVQADTVEFDIPRLLAGYNGPIVVVASKADEVIAFPVTRRLAQKLKDGGKTVAFIELEGSGHSQIRKNPEYRTKVKKALGAFGLEIGAPPTAWVAPAPKACSDEHVQDGCGTLTWPDGSQYVGGFRGGFFHGHGVLAYADGTKFEGDYVDGDGGGIATYTMADGTKITGEFHDAHPDAPAQSPVAQPVAEDGTLIQISSIVLEDGSVTNSMADLPRGFSNLDANRFYAGATRAISKLKYHPATIDGHRVRSVMFTKMKYTQGNRVKEQMPNPIWRSLRR